MSQIGHIAVGRVGYCTIARDGSQVGFTEANVIDHKVFDCSYPQKKDCSSSKTINCAACRIQRLGEVDATLKSKD
jgi:hypothetical protein